jgi:hypothetical protein
MKSYLLIILSLVTGSAWADWQKMYDQKGNTVYIDADSTSFIRADDKLPIIWVLVNYNTRSPWGDLSTIERTEFDCKEERYRTLTNTGYSEPMAQGKISGASTQSREYVSEWHRIASGNLFEPVLKKVCLKP